jgi:hypothetical protein
MVQLLDSTFGWSRQFGRHAWQRHQYDGLHRVISRDVTVGGNMPEFRFAAGAQAWPEYHQTAPVPPSKYNLWAWLLREPRNLLIGYMGYRALQVLWRLVA